MTAGATEKRQGGEDSRLERAPGAPLYHQIVLVLQDRIRSGAIAPGSYLAGENDLSAEFGVSRITAKRALNELAQAGLVVRERGRGTRVVDRPMVPVVTVSVARWRDSVTEMGRSTSVVVLDLDYVPAPRTVAAALELAPGATVQRAVRLRRLGDTPMSYLVTHVPELIGRRYGREDLGNRPLHQLLEEAGVRIAGARQTISASAAGPAVAAALGIPAGSPLIEVTRVVGGADGTPVEHICALYRPDLYRLEMRTEDDRSAP